jgi:hypothetical protein
MSNIHNLVLIHGREGAKKIVPPEDKRLVDIAAEFLGEDKNSISYMYSGFAMTTLPHKQLPDDMVWERKNGPLSLLVEPGMIYDQGTAVKYGVPYGSRARLIMFYLQTEAIRRRTRVIHLGNSMTDWMGRMGINPGGSNFAAVKDQTSRLSACRLTVGFVAPDGKHGFTRENIVSAMINPPPLEGDARQGRLWEETAELSIGFYEALLAHPVPCEERAIKFIQNSSTAIDVYIWLCYRLHALTKPALISWEKMRDQFGPHYKDARKFKYNFVRTILKEVTAVYPEANVEAGESGFRLKPSPAPVPYKPVQVLLPPTA